MAPRKAGTRTILVSCDSTTLKGPSACRSVRNESVACAVYLSVISAAFTVISYLLSSPTRASRVAQLVSIQFCECQFQKFIIRDDSPYLLIPCQTFLETDATSIYRSA